MIGIWLGVAWRVGIEGDEGQMKMEMDEEMGEEERVEQNRREPPGDQ